MRNALQIIDNLVNTFNNTTVTESQKMQILVDFIIKDIHTVKQELVASEHQIVILEAIHTLTGKAMEATKERKE